MTPEKDISSIAPGYCHCGCGAATPLARKTDRRRGSVKGQPTLYLKAHHLRASPVCVIVNRITGCWDWQWTRTRGGYGLVTVRGRRQLAHRLFYRELRGTIPPGHQLHHRCKNRGCVNPWHLTPMTPREHKAVTGSSYAARKLTPDQVREIVAIGYTESGTIVAARYGVTDSVIYNIRLGLSYRAITHGQSSE